MLLGALVVPIAAKPASSKTRALAASQPLGSKRFPSVFIFRKTSAFAAVNIGKPPLTYASRRTSRPDRSKTRFLEDTCTRRVTTIGKQEISLSVHLPEDFSFCGC